MWPGIPFERLQAMKALHERRIEITTAIGPDKQSHVLLYGANIGLHSSPLSFGKAADAMLPDRYPADLHPLTLGMINSSFTDRDAAFWQLESSHLRNMVAQTGAPPARARFHQPSFDLRAGTAASPDAARVSTL